jgi:hypothetical protein
VGSTGGSREGGGHRETRRWHRGQDCAEKWTGKNLTMESSPLILEMNRKQEGRGITPEHWVFSSFPPEGRGSLGIPGTCLRVEQKTHV